MASLVIADPVTTESDPSSIEARLRKVKLEIKKATQAALKHSTTTGPSLSSSFNNDDENDPNASFHLGMELFGQEASVMEHKLQEQLTRIERDLQHVVEQVQQHSYSCDENNNNNNNGLENVTTQQNSQQIHLEADTLRTKLNFLMECSKARAYLDESITLSTPALAPNEEPDWVQGAKLVINAECALVEAEKILVQETQLNPGSPILQVAYTVMDSIRSSMRHHKVELIGKATSLWHTCVTVGHNSITIRTGGGNGTAVTDLATAYDILEALQEETVLEATLRNFTRTLHQDVFQPLLLELGQGTTNPTRIFHEIVDRTSEKSSTHLLTTTERSRKGSVRRLEWTCSEDQIVNKSARSNGNNQTIEGWGQILQYLQRIIVFVAEYALLQRESLCSFVALRLFGKPNALPSALNLEALGLESCRLGDDHGLLLLPLVDALEQTCIPHYLKPSELGELPIIAKHLAKYLEPFLKEIASKQMLPLDGKNRLSTFVSSIEQKYVDYRQCQLLNEARDMLVNNDYHNTVRVGEAIKQNKDDEVLGIKDGMMVFKLHESSISDTAFKLMVQCRKIMDEAVDCQGCVEHSPLSILPATLYRTAREILDLFRAIIPVVHGHEVANVPRTAAVLHNDCVYLSHHCLTLGLEYRGKFPEVAADDLQGKLLRQTCMFVDMVPLFRDLADRSLGCMLESQAKELTILVGERIPLMGKALRSEEILQEWSDAETALQAGLHHLTFLSKAWRPILSIDILNRSMCYLTDVLLTLFLDQLTKAQDISTSGCHFVNSLFHKALSDLDVLLDGNMSQSRLWGRFSVVGKVMDMSLADIQVGLSDGMFRSLTGVELSRLITSCFDDTPKRRALLKTLSTNH